MTARCKRNHLLTDSNLYVNPRGSRECRRCRVGYKAAYVKRQGRPGLVDATKTVERLRWLHAQGMAIDDIAERSGVGARVIFRLIHGGRGQARVQQSTATAIAAVRPVARRGKVRISPVGSRRRLEALQALGWPMKVLAEKYGVHRNTLWNVLVGTFDTIEVATAGQIKQIYDDLWDKPAPAATPLDEMWRDRTVRNAAARGYAPPLAWDDESIDDPAAEPHGVADTTCSADGCAAPVLAKGLCNRHYKQQRGGGIDTTSARGLTPGRPRLDDVDELIVDAFLEGHRVTLTHADALEVIRRLLQRGRLSHTQIAEHVGTSPRTVARVSSELQQEAAA